jgi:type II secretory pathway predicted ATPase ExeA
MYEQYFHLSETPFRLTPDPRFLYITPKHRETLSALVYGVMARKGFMVVSGDAGTGKTTLIHAVLGMLTERKVDCAFIFHPLLGPEDFLEHVLLDLGIPPPSRQKGDMLRALHLFLLKRHESGSTTALIVDEAHKLTETLLEEIRLFSNLETSTDKLLQIVLAGQSELDDLFRQENLRQLKQRISIRTRLIPFTLQQTAEYIHHRLGTVGRESSELFPPDTVPLIYLLSRGIPRLINSVCDNALLIAFAQQAECVSIPMLREVCTDLDLGDMAAFDEQQAAAVRSSASPFASPSPSSASPFASPAPPRRNSPLDSPARAASAVDTAAAVSTDEEPAKLPEEAHAMAAVPADSLHILDSYSERKGTMGLLSKWANRFRNP